MLPFGGSSNYLAKALAFGPNFLQLRNAGLVVAAASVAAANPIEYHLGLFLRIHDNIHEGV